MYFQRYLEDEVLKIHRTFKVLYLGGPRQAGKTTLLNHLARTFKLNYVTLDHRASRRLAQKDPELFLQKYPAPLLIDEVQYAPELFPFIKIAVDQTDRRGQYWLTGSQQFAVMKQVKESLAGRVGILQLLGFSFAETKQLPKMKEPFFPGRKSSTGLTITIRTLFSHMLRGSFPMLYHHKPPEREAFYDSYLQTYIDRDLREIFHVAKISSFHTFVGLCAARTGQILNISELARDSGISVPTASEWLSILESSMQIYLLRPYYRNISKRLIKAPKLYFLDTGLAAFLTKWNTVGTLMDGAMAGAFFETFVMSEIVKSYLFRGKRPPLFYFRDKEGHEVDCLIERNQTLYPLEIKIAAVPDETDLKNIRYVRKKFKNIGNGGIVCLAKENLPLDRHDDIIPVGMIS